MPIAASPFVRYVQEGWVRYQLVDKADADKESGPMRKHQPPTQNVLFSTSKTWHFDSPPQKFPRFSIQNSQDFQFSPPALISFFCNSRIFMKHIVRLSDNKFIVTFNELIYQSATYKSNRTKSDNYWDKQRKASASAKALHLTFNILTSVSR